MTAANRYAPCTAAELVRALRPASAGIATIVCLGFTAPTDAWAEGASLPGPTVEYVENPYAPHTTRGSAARLGTAVGRIYGEHRDVTAVGLVAGLGYRVWRFTFDTEYAYLGFQEEGPSSLSLGAGHRLALLGRFDAIRLGSDVVGGNSMLAIYVEAGVGVAWNHWSRPAYDEANRLVPLDTKRAEGLAGFGLMLDHRLQEPIGFPRRVAWFLGWRAAVSPHDSEPAEICRGVSCRPAPPMPEPRYTDRSILFQSSLAFTW